MKQDNHGYQIVLPVAHAQVHLGKLVSLSDYESGISAAATKYWHLKTPNITDSVHTKFKVASNQGCLVQFFEGPTLTDNGTKLTPQPFNRNKSDLTGVLAYKDPTVSADGVLLGIDRIGADNKANGTARTETEFVLKPNTSYLVKVTADSNGTEIVLQSDFYTDEG